MAENICDLRADDRLEEQFGTLWFRWQVSMIKANFVRILKTSNYILKKIKERFFKRISKVELHTVAL